LFATDGEDERRWKEFKRSAAGIYLCKSDCSSVAIIFRIFSSFASSRGQPSLASEPRILESQTGRKPEARQTRPPHAAIPRLACPAGLGTRTVPEEREAIAGALPPEKNLTTENTDRMGSDRSRPQKNTNDAKIKRKIQYLFATDGEDERRWKEFKGCAAGIYLCKSDCSSVVIFRIFSSFASSRGQPSLASEPRILESQTGRKPKARQTRPPHAAIPRLACPAGLGTRTEPEEREAIAGALPPEKNLTTENTDRMGSDRSRPQKNTNDAKIKREIQCLFATDGEDERRWKEFKRSAAGIYLCKSDCSSVAIIFRICCVLCVFSRPTFTCLRTAHSGKPNWTQTGGATNSSAARSNPAAGGSCGFGNMNWPG
jgi:hypothetical protein